MVIAKRYVYAKHFDGLPKETDFQVVQEELPPLKDGEFLSEAIYISVDPFMRSFAPNLELNTTYIAYQVARIIESRNSKHTVGQHIVGNLGCRTHTISNDETELWVLPDIGQLPLSLSLGVLGLPGITAYFGFLEICQPKAGETVVVTGAAGAVGSTVGQIAKIKGCKVIGIAGSDAKGKWLLDELNFDHFVNYKDPNFEAELQKVAPNGIDCYFDNVGGETSSTVLSLMNLHGRVSCCGAISSYNDVKPEKVTGIQRYIVKKQLKLEGFMVWTWRDRMFECISQHKKWVEEGKMKYRETITVGFENLVTAFVDMLQGKNVGKAIVQIKT